MSPLVNGLNTITASNTRLYREHYVYVGQATKDNGGPNFSLGVGWYPDGLIPFANAAGQDLAGIIDAVPFNLPAGQNAVVWADVFVPSGTPAGTYSGILNVTSTQGDASVPITLTVWTFTLPIKPTLKSLFQYYSGAPGAGIPAVDGGTPDAQRELLRHGLTPMWMLNADLAASQTLGPTAKDLHFWSGANWTNCAMLSPLPSTNDLIANMTGIPAGVGIYNYTADEISPCTNLYPQIQQWARNIHAAGAKQLITMPPVAALYDDGSGTGRSAVDAWVVLPKLWNSSDVQYVQAKGDEVWSYTAVSQDGYSPKWQIDFSPMNTRITGFLGAALGIKGILYWAVDYWFYTSDPWNDVNNASALGGENYPGEGMLVYPGTPVGLPGTVVPSMRLKQLRSAVQDFEYVELLKQAGQGSWALQTVRSIASSWSSWTQDPNAIESVRLQLGQALDGGATQVVGMADSTVSSATVTVTQPSPPAGSNLAQGKTASQSSTFPNPTAGPGGAVDGNTDGDFGHGSVTHTDLTPSPWWQVDLGASASVSSIVIWNRTDCCGTRLSDYWVFVSNTPFGSTDTPTTLQSRALTWSSHQTAAPNPSTTITTGGVQGRYVRVQLTGSDYLSLAEVQVMGAMPNSGSNLAQGKTASQSSTFPNPTAGPQGAVDGNTDGDFGHGSVTHTDLATNPWWQVDLGASAAVGSIVIWNRTDCCGTRLSDYWVFVSNTPFGSTDTPATLQSRALTWSSHQTAAPNPSTTIRTGGAQGRYVRVQLTGTDYLSLAEVQVIAQ
jgi:hypothetical protein